MRGGRRGTRRGSVFHHRKMVLSGPVFDSEKRRSRGQSALPSFVQADRQGIVGAKPVLGAPLSLRRRASWKPPVQKPRSRSACQEPPTDPSKRPPQRMSGRDDDRFPESANALLGDILRLGNF